MSASTQVPIPEIAQLRTGHTWAVRDLEVPCQGCVPLPGPMSPALDMSIILHRCVQYVTSLRSQRLWSLLHRRTRQHVQRLHLVVRVARHHARDSLTPAAWPRKVLSRLCRGDAESAGLLFRSWNAGGEGSAAILFDFDRNILEAVFEVSAVAHPAVWLPYSCSQPSLPYGVMLR